MQMGGKTNLPNIHNTQDIIIHHLATIKRIVEKAQTEYVWVVSDLCDYTDFDFTWQSKFREAEQIHCWASGKQQFGDTFLVPVRAFKGPAEDPKVLGWYKHRNWHSNENPLHLEICMIG